MKKINIILTILLITITTVAGFTKPTLALAATSPSLGTTNTFGIVSSTYTNSLNSGTETKIIGDICYTTPPATTPTSVSGATITPCANGVDQAAALASLNNQSCTSLGANVVLSGTYTPGCYSSSGSMDIALSTTVTLNGAGVYIFRSGGALTTGANSVVALANGASAVNVFWTPVGGATLGANSSTSATPTFVGTIIANALGSTGITLGRFANVTGRLLAFGHTVTTDSNTITAPTTAVGPVYIDSNLNMTLDSGEQSFNTIQSAINAANPGNTIVVTSGTYTEAVNDTKGVTLRAQGAAMIIGQVTLNATNSKIFGFDVTNPNGNYGIIINGFGNTEASNNNVHHIGMGSTIGANHGIYFQDKNLVDADNIKIQNNTISNIGTTMNGSNSGTGIGDSTGNSNLTGVSIVGNTISNITANTNPVSPGKGAYGIIINHAIHNIISNMGSTLGAQVTGNTITTLNGRWAHGIGLEGSTPNAVVTGNTMSNFTSSSVSNDAAAVVFQDNDGAASVTLHNNNFDTNTIAFGVENLVPLITVDVTENYWGGSNITASKFYGLVNFSPWYTNSGRTTLSSVTSGSTVTVATGNLNVQITSSGAASLPVGTSNVVLGDSSVLSVASSTNTASGGTIVIAGASIPLSNFTSGNLTGLNLTTPKYIGGQSVIVGAAVQLSSGSNGVPTTLTNSTIAGTSVSIPDDTTILAPSGWNGTISPPKTRSSVGDSAPPGFSVSANVVEVGSPNYVLLFDKPVQITLSGVTGSVGYKPSGLTSWTIITSTCGGTYGSPTISASSFPGECAISNGTDTKILTYHLTSFGGLSSPLATLHIIKLVVNGSGGTGRGILRDSDFMIHVKSAGVDVSTPQPGVAAPGTLYSLPAGTYTVNEDVNMSYVKSYNIVGGCDQNGTVTLAAGEEKTCTIVNTDIPLPGPVIVPTHESGSNPIYPIIVPSIGIIKVPTPLSLPNGPGSVTYNYTVWNAGGPKALTDIKITDDKCTTVTYISGDLNGNKKLDMNENWKYSCTASLLKTTTNTATVTGYSDDYFKQISIAAVISTVVVGVSSPAPLINIISVPSRLVPFPFGGGDVMYTYTVTNPGLTYINNVTVTDNKCKQILRISGDINFNNLLDPSETWVYGCRTNISVSTRSIATAQGKSNGFSALGYGFATVLVSSPLLPDAGSIEGSTGLIRDISINLSKGSRGNNVKVLQEFLISENKGIAAEALNINGTTLYFGPLTRSALAEWQKFVGIFPPLGNFGPITRNYLKAY